MRHDIPTAYAVFRTAWSAVHFVLLALLFVAVVLWWFDDGQGGRLLAGWWRGLGRVQRSDLQPHAVSLGRRMSGPCPDCGGTLRNGACFKCGYRAPDSTMAKSKSAWQRRDGAAPPAPLPVPPGSAPPPDPAPTGSAPFPPPAAPAVTAVPASRTSWWGSMTVRGKIVEVGEPRSHSVSLAGNLAAEQLARGCVTAPFRAIGIMVGILFAPFRMLLGPSLAPGRRPDGPDRFEVPVHPFLVQDEDGTEYDCSLRGELRGGFLRMGDPVEVAGRLDRQHVLRVSSVVNLRTRSVSRGYVDPKARYATARGVVAFVMIIFLIYVLVSVYS